jgi:hypothetical protein
MMADEVAGVHRSDRRRSAERRGKVPHAGYIVFTHPSGAFVQDDSSRLHEITRKSRKTGTSPKSLPATLRTQRTSNRSSSDYDYSEGERRESPRIAYRRSVKKEPSPCDSDTLPPHHALPTPAYSTLPSPASSYTFSDVTSTTQTSPLPPTSPPWIDRTHPGSYKGAPYSRSNEHPAQCLVAPSNSVHSFVGGHNTPLHPQAMCDASGGVSPQPPSQNYHPLQYPYRPHVDPAPLPLSPSNSDASSALSSEYYATGALKLYEPDRAPYDTPASYNTVHDYNNPSTGLANSRRVMRRTLEDDPWLPMATPAPTCI